MARRVDPIETLRAIKPSSSTIADVLDAFGVDGALPGEIRSVNTSSHYFIGTAYTVQWTATRKSHDILAPQASTWDQVRDFLAPDISSGKGRVYVAGAGPLLTTAALAGGLSSTYFSQIGFEGMVLGGAMRDIPDTRRLAMPVLASNPCPTDTQGCYRVSEVGTSCFISNKRIRTGDVVISDDTGTVVIPIEFIGDVIQRAAHIEKTENEILEQIRMGRRLPDLIAERGRI